MKVVVSGQHLEMTDALKEYAEKKIGKIDHFFSEAINGGKIELIHHQTKSPEKSNEVKVFINLHGAKISAREENADMYAAIDLVFDKAGKQLKKFKEKTKNRKREKLSVAITEARMHADEHYDDVDHSDGPIVHVYEYDFKPMAVDDALLEIQASGKKFFVFKNSENNQLNVLYPRSDGDYSLIEAQH
jgi:putative sigma-54 modulation protein